jgi:hypothetical protein
MTHKLRAGAAAALLLLIASVAVASAASSRDKRASRSDHSDSIVLHLLAKEVQETYVDVGDPDYSQGDVFVFNNHLFRGDKKVGEDGGACIVSLVAPDGASTIYCSGSNSLPGGQIATAGLVDYGPTEEVRQDPYSLPITGGTGKYRAARGEVTIKELSTKEFRLTFRVIL